MGLRPGLERIRALLERLGHPERRFAPVLVAGTNGKGSTARALASILTAAGKKTGLFLSPHLTRYNERFLIGGREIEDERLLDLIRELRPHIEATGATFFEASAAIAMQYFAEEGVEVGVLEVGLGGRLDATNAAEPVLSLVTAIGFDHTKFLGDTLAAIAREKAGIFRPGVPALTSATGEALAALKERAKELGTPLEPVRPEFVATRGLGIRFGLLGQTFEAPLLGRHQGENLALATRAASRLGVGEEAVRKGLYALKNPGRLELLFPFLLDGAHNAEGARALARALADHFPSEKKVLVFGASRDKDHRGMAEALGGLFEAVYLTRYSGERSADPKELLPLFPGAKEVAEPILALELARREHPDALVVVAGSLYLLGEVRPWVLRQVGADAA